MIARFDLANLTENDIIVASRDLDVEAIIKAVNQADPTFKNWIMFDDDPKNAIHVLTEKEMNRAGWYRKYA